VYSAEKPNWMHKNNKMNFMELFYQGEVLKDMIQANQ
jgi:hypothetical protein